MYAYALFDTAIGRCGLAWNDRGIVGVQLPEKTPSLTRTRLLRLCPTAEESAPPKTIQHAIDDITSLMRGKRKNLRIHSLDMSRTPAFNARVYETARAIAPGKTRTYGEIARAIGDASAARAVGQALGRNPFPVIVPCHRVIGADGRMIGFSANGGVAMKLRLLEIEGWRAEEPSLFDALH
ncbi:MAG: methylated-DNA--[protein]-cysteine S-methyltransferase [Hyphomonadaceae bacterium]|nr:methylated-DNA--[protein]-cysteine S-methyltransferase [Hyphomonadaceae bacterium]